MTKFLNFLVKKTLILFPARTRAVSSAKKREFIRESYEIKTLGLTIFFDKI